MTIDQSGEDEEESTTREEKAVELEIPAEYRYLNLVGACLSALLERATEDRERQNVTYSVELAVHEICTNIVEHAYEHYRERIHITMQLHDEPRRLVIMLMDTGQPFDWSTVTEPDLSTPQEGNYGLFLARNLIDHLDYRRESEKNLWRLIKYL